ncbi:MAG: M16 family metallopeptidase, partial [Geminicoccaceae bacterium]
MLAELLAAPPRTALQSSARVEEVVSASGVRAYLIREPRIPFLALSFHIRGGGALDPPGREGLAYMASGLLDEGAGPYDSQAFRAQLEDHAIRLQIEADRDGVQGDLRTLTAHREHAFELLRLALTKPRFDAEPVERVRSQILADLRRRESDPDY